MPYLDRQVDDKTWFPVEHLASVTIEMKQIYSPTVEDGVWAIKEFGGFWTKTMDLNISIEGVILQNDQSHQELQRHPVASVASTGCLLDDEDFGDLFCFITKHSSHHQVRSLAGKRTCFRGERGVGGGGYRGVRGGV